MKKTYFYLFSFLSALILPSCNSRSDSFKFAFNKENIILKEEETISLEINCNKDIDLNDVIYTYDTSIISYSDFNVSALKEGKTTITATYNEYETSCMVFVLNKDAAEFTLSNEELVLDPNKHETLYVFKDNEIYENVYWRSSDLSICEVGQNGVLTPKKPGICNITAEVHGTLLTAKIKVFGVDGLIDDWYLGEEPLYKGAGVNDMDNEERGYYAFARYTTDGLYFAGYAMHSQYVNDKNYWYGNTNFEVFVNINGSVHQFYVTENIMCPGTTGKMSSILNPDSISVYDKYLTTFELFIPLEPYNIYHRASFAFKTEGETMSFVVGGTSPVVTTTDWWWIDLHYPNNLDEMWYIYQDGLHSTGGGY